MRSREFAAVVGTILMTAAAAGAGEVGAPDSRVRASSAASHQLLVRAAARAETVARLIADLEATDVVVIVELRPLPNGVNGMVRVAAASPSIRYLRLTLAVPNDERHLIASLGHELRHAIEIAKMPDVLDDISLAEAYRRIGRARRGGGFFETDAALETGRAVARELAGR